MCKSPLAVFWHLDTDHPGVLLLSNPAALQKMTAPPPISRQKTFIVENANILDFKTKKTILSLVMMEVGRVATSAVPAGGVVARQVVIENGTTSELSINLDNIDKPEVLLHIYNIVSGRRAALSAPISNKIR